MIGRVLTAAHGQEKTNQSAKWGAGQAADATAVCAPDHAWQMGRADGGRATGFSSREGGSAADRKAARTTAAAANSADTGVRTIRRQKT